MLDEILGRSRATAPFREALARFRRDGQPSAALSFTSQCPAVKVERAVTKALVEYPELEVESIDVRGASGCEFFRGVMEVRTAGEVRRVSFHWDCKWRAEQLGWRDWFGFPDQARAARELGYDCFRSWHEESVTPRLATAHEGAGEAVPA
ncbi:MAG TPA: hypothetical protein VHG91_20625 [Longimicrobium sp.]|nr:hypothetical protein [Longimicrobium sp.]